MATEAEFLTAYERIKDTHRALMAEVDAAIAFEESESPTAALAAYTRCLGIIDAIFAIPVGLPDHTDAIAAEWSDACATIQELKSTQRVVLHRLKRLRAQIEVATEAVEAADRVPPAMEVDATTETQAASTRESDGFDRTYAEYSAGLRAVVATKESGATFDTLFQSPAKLYKINADGAVATVAGATPMSLVLCSISSGGSDDRWAFLNGVFFIQCTMPPAPEAAAAASAEQPPDQSLIWIYALVPGVVNCYRTDYGAFILPDLEAPVAGGAFGLMLVESPPEVELAATAALEFADLQQHFVDLLEAVLTGSVQPLAAPLGESVGRQDISESVSSHIVSAADFVARNLVRGAEKSGELMTKGTPYLMSMMAPVAAQAPSVPPPMMTAVVAARNVTNVAADVTGYVATKVGAASMALGRFLAPRVQTALQRSFGHESELEGALTIAAGAVEGVSTIYAGLETSARILGGHFSDNSVKIIEHKYGPSVGEAASLTFDSVGNAFNVSQNVNYIMPKGLVKKVAKTTGRAVVEDLRKPPPSTDAKVVAAGALRAHLRQPKAWRDEALP